MIYIYTWAIIYNTSDTYEGFICYSRHFHNGEKVLHAYANKEYCENNNIKYIQWNDGDYMTPKETEYTIVSVLKKEGTEQQRYNNSQKSIPICLKKSITKTKDDPSIKFKMCPCDNLYIGVPNILDIISRTISEIRIYVLAFSIYEHSKIFLCVVRNFVYNYNFQYPFIIMLLNNTKKMYTLPNYHYEYITIKFVEENEMIVLIAEDMVPKEACISTYLIYWICYRLIQSCKQSYDIRLNEHPK
ncbi:hypothetical protein H8356DRAFT_1354315 [Neocallimastix lanati (nom. inval.)]|nr:hypothetical protein H8356DRAFT_1354315 [Neocallimastix sp. JGI-2020a]